MLRIAVQRGFFRVGHPVLVGIHCVRIERAIHHIVQLVEERIHLPIDLIAQVVAEIVFCAMNEECLRARRIGVGFFFPINQSDTCQRRQQRCDPIDRHIGFLRDLGGGFRAFREICKDADM